MLSEDELVGLAAQALRDRAFECEEPERGCVLDEVACRQQHPVLWTASQDGEVYVEGRTEDLARVVVEALRGRFG